MTFKFTSAFLKTADYDNSTVQILYNSEDTEAIIDFTKLVEDEDLAKDGRETDPHITVLYGIHERIPYDLDLTQTPLPQKVEWEGLSKFEAAAHDVLIIKIKKDSKLQGLFDLLNKVYSDNSNSFPDFVPHTTIAYVKKGMADKYIKEYGDTFTGPCNISIIQFAFNSDKWDFNPATGKQEQDANEREV